MLISCYLFHNKRNNHTMVLTVVVHVSAHVQQMYTAVVQCLDIQGAPCKTDRTRDDERNARDDRRAARYGKTPDTLRVARDG